MFHSSAYSSLDVRGSYSIRSYKLAEAEGYPFARDYLEGISDYGSYGSDPKQAEIQARWKAERWLSPFEFYAAETRYRGELPSGLVLSDEEKAAFYIRHDTYWR